MSFTDPIADRKIRTGPQDVAGARSVFSEVYWYNRRLMKEIPGIGKRREIIKKINSWAGGLMVFRDFFRINPYGWFRRRTGLS